MAEVKKSAKKSKVCAFSSSGACTPLCVEYNRCKRNPWKVDSLEGGNKNVSK